MFSRFCGSSVASNKSVRRLAACNETNCKALSVVLGDPITLRSPQAQDTATRVLENTTSSLQFGTCRQSSGIDFSPLVLNHVWTRQEINSIGPVPNDIFKRSVFHLPCQHAQPFAAVHNPLSCRGRGFGTGPLIIKPPQEVISFPIYDPHGIPSEEERGEIQKLYEPFVELYMKSDKTQKKKKITWGAFAEAIKQTPPEMRHSLLKQIPKRNLTIINDNSLSDVCLVFQKPDFSKYDLTVNVNATPQDNSRMNHVHSVIVRNARGDLEFWDNNVIENVYIHQATSELQAMTLAGQILRGKKDLKNMKIVFQSASLVAVQTANFCLSINREKGGIL